MKKIEDGIVFSYDIERILKGVNSLDFDYGVVPSSATISAITLYFFTLLSFSIYYIIPHILYTI